MIMFLFKFQTNLDAQNGLHGEIARQDGEREHEEAYVRDLQQMLRNVQVWRKCSVYQGYNNMYYVTCIKQLLGKYIDHSEKLLKSRENGRLSNRHTIPFRKQVGKLQARRNCRWRGRVYKGFNRARFALHKVTHTQKVQVSVWMLCKCRKICSFQHHFES